jgi:hypothetical protein
LVVLLEIKRPWGSSETLSRGFPPSAALQKDNGRSSTFPTVVTLPSGLGTTLAGPHVEHLRSETHTVIIVGSEGAIGA